MLLKLRIPVVIFGFEVGNIQEKVPQKRIIVTIVTGQNS